MDKQRLVLLQNLLLNIIQKNEHQSCGEPATHKTSFDKGGVKMTKKLRTTYAVIFGVLLLTEIIIALFVHDNFVRPYIGDVLVTVLLCCLCRIVIPKGVPLLPLYVFIFAALVEIAQYFDVVKLLSLENNAFISTIIGRTFSFIDLLCYAVGCLLFVTTESGVKFCLR